MATTRLGLSGTPQTEGGSFVTKYDTQITRFGLMGVTMKRYGSFTMKPSQLFKAVWAVRTSKFIIGK
jgi:hypothetical protein